MVIIAILAAVAIPIYLTQQSKGYDASAKSDIRTVARELETYNTDANSYPNAATNPSPVVVGTVTLKSSPGNSVSWFLNPTKTAFCVVSVNAKGTHPWEYISSLGGLQPASTFPAGTTLPTACSTSSY
jgi:type IV pilus assembly protein PilA